MTANRHRFCVHSASRNNDTSMGVFNMTAQRLSPVRNSNALLEPLEARRLLASGTNSFSQFNLVGNSGSIFSIQTDPKLVNPWGLAVNPTTGAIWISDNGK